MPALRPLVAAITLPLLATGALAMEGLADLNLETHGFVSFGHLKTWGNNWLGDTRDGSSEFWEAAANVTARPMDHLRLGAQIFARDLGIYGDGKAELDWAYADWRVSDVFGVQVGRVTQPLGLHSDEIDVDAARPNIFLPRLFIYPLRSRDIQQSTDGGKIYGTVGALDWAAFLGNRRFANDSDFAKGLMFLSRLFSRITDIDSDYSAGFMAHWRTPLPGLALRLCGSTVQGLNIEGVSLSGAAAVESRLPEFYYGAFALLYETADFTWCAEYGRQRANRHVIISPYNGAPRQELRNTRREDDAYLSLTWHAQPWLDCYAAVEGLWDNPTDRHGSPYSQNAVAALALMPTAHWVLKAEYRYMHGTKDIDPTLNPDGIARDTHVLALKTTVDF